LRVEQQSLLLSFNKSGINPDLINPEDNPPQPAQISIKFIIIKLIHFFNLNKN
jgi:hypothetical protein